MCFLVLREAHSTYCYPWGAGLDTHSCLLPVDRLFVPKGQCLSTVSLCLEQSQALHLLDSDESGMALKSLPFHTSHFNQKWAEARGQETGSQEAKIVTSSGLV